MFEQALSRLTDADWTVEDTPVRHAHDAATICLHLVLPEAAAVHASSLADRPTAYTPSVRLRLELGRYVMAEDYARAQHGRTVLGLAVDAALDGRDALVLPSLAIPAPPLGRTTVDIGGETESFTRHHAAADTALQCHRTPSGLHPVRAHEGRTAVWAAARRTPAPDGPPAGRGRSGRDGACRRLKNEPSLNPSRRCCRRRSHAVRRSQRYPGSRTRPATLSAPTRRRRPGRWRGRASHRTRP